MTPHRTAIAALLVATVAAGPASAFNPNPDWPCQGRKMLHLSWGQMWTGPALPDDPQWQEDEEFRRIVPLIAARRTPMETVEEIVASVAGTGETDRLVTLFAAVFEEIDDERARIVEGIERYARKQRALAEKIDGMRTEAIALEAEAGPEDYDALDRLEELQDRITWDTRIYEDRRQSLAAVCETPVILEQRAFAVARIVQGALAD